MSIPIVKRDQGDTSPAVTVQLYSGGSPYNLSGASVIGVVAGTVGSGLSATYQRFVLPATWNTASLGMASVAIPLLPSGASVNNYACATPARLSLEIRAVGSDGLVTQWPQDEAIPFIVRAKL